jgi:23S rRNA pseudouridine2605 synthase
VTRQREYKRGHVALERAISKLRLASRSEAQRLVRAGQVRVNGRVVTDPLAPVVPERDAIGVAGKTRPALAWRTIAFHKPRGTVTTRRDPQGRPTVFDVLGAAADGLVAVGRLDQASSGLLLLTSDTRLANDLTDPANAIVRRYVVTVRGEVSDEQRKLLERGVGGMAPSRVEIRKRSRRETHPDRRVDRGKEPPDPPAVRGDRSRGHAAAAGRLRPDRARHAAAGRVARHQPRTVF